MRRFRCRCGALLFFDNSVCAACGSSLGFVPERLTLQALQPAQEGVWLTDDGLAVRFCANHLNHAVCNWVMPADDPAPLCRSCRLNGIIPDLSVAEHLPLWHAVERAKRRLLYSLFALGLPVIGRDQDPEHGLIFDFPTDRRADTEFTERLETVPDVTTGHESGRITIDLAEADEIARLRARRELGERYRTLLGHFRHEIGHYYWFRRVNREPLLGEFRALFGDERVDYGEALQRHYGQSQAGALPPPDFISNYASAHPWEDWAETFAHYLHIVDGVETAADYRISVEQRVMGAAGLPTQGGAGDFEALLADWHDLALALNSLNRSMGQEDPYPFVMSDPIHDKLKMIHRVVTAPE